MSEGCWPLDEALERKGSASYFDYFVSEARASRISCAIGVLSL
jgi:hypothetical protein